MANVGVYPLDPETAVGQFRLAFGDIDSAPLSPVVSGYQDYTDYSDVEITQFLAMGSDSINRSIGYAILQESRLAARKSKTVKDYDLAVDLTKRAEDLRKSALIYFKLADTDDALAGDFDEFLIVDTGNDRDEYDYVEGFPYWPGLRS